LALPTTKVPSFLGALVTARHQQAAPYAFPYRAYFANPIDINQVGFW